MAMTRSAVLVGAEIREIEVEAFVGQGFSGLNILGIGGDALRDMRERVRAVLESAGLPLPARRIVVNLVPAQALKLSRTPLAELEFAVAAAVVRALEAARGRSAPEHAEFFLGGLSLSGEIRPLAHPLLLASLALEKSKTEVSFASGPDAHPPATRFRTFAEWYAVRHEAPPPRQERGNRQEPAEGPDPHRLAATLSLFQETPWLLVALMAAAAGGHHILLCGEPGVGKSFALRHLGDLLPPLSLGEKFARELLVGEQAGANRPVRAPHHTTTAAALIGGAQARLGEVTLAHSGLLFLDELAEFSRAALEGLREPLDSGVVELSRAAGVVRLPASFLLAASTNPCGCGYLLSRRKPCRCPQGDARKYQKKFSGPLLDRFALQLLLQPDGERDQAGNVFVTTAQRLLRERGGLERLARRLSEVQRVRFSLEARARELRAVGESVPHWLAQRVSRRGERELISLAGTLAALFPEAAGEGIPWEHVEAFRRLEGLLGSPAL